MRLAREDSVVCPGFQQFSFVQEQPPLSLAHPSSKGTPTSLLSFAWSNHSFLLLLLGLRLTLL